jgi:hypothetical protein
MTNGQSIIIFLTAISVFLFLWIQIGNLIKWLKSIKEMKSKVNRLEVKNAKLHEWMNQFESAFNAHLSHVSQKYDIGDTFGEYIITNVSDFRVNGWFVDYEYETFNTKTNVKQTVIQAGMDAIVRECGKKENNTNRIKNLKFEPLFEDNPTISSEDVSLHFMTVDGKSYKLGEDGNLKEVTPQKIDISGKKEEE